MKIKIETVITDLEQKYKYKWTPEYQFHEPEPGEKKRRWRFDFAQPELKIAIEIEGGVYGRGKPCPVCKRKAPGAHSSVTGMKRDIEKYNTAVKQGWAVLRVLPSEIDKVYDYIHEVIYCKAHDYIWKNIDR
jgi:DNA repair exonuclease SbcCD ATPase subunit